MPKGQPQGRSPAWRFAYWGALCFAGCGYQSALGPSHLQQLFYCMQGPAVQSVDAQAQLALESGVRKELQQAGAQEDCAKGLGITPVLGPIVVTSEALVAERGSPLARAVRVQAQAEGWVKGGPNGERVWLGRCEQEVLVQASSSEWQGAEQQAQARTAAAFAAGQVLGRRVLVQSSRWAGP